MRNSAKIIQSVNKKPRFIVDNTETRRGKKNMSRGVTLVLCFSRPWCVSPFFRNFERIDFDRSKVHLIIYNNTDNAILDGLLLEIARRYQQTHKQKYGERKTLQAFASVRLYKSFRRVGGVVFGQTPTFDSSKLPVIIDMHKDIAGMITTDTFFMLEDDTLPPPHAFTRLMAKLKSDAGIGLVGGVEPSRTPYPTDTLRLGAYKISWKHNRLLERISLTNDLKGFVDVDATGWYCFAARTVPYCAALRTLIKNFERYKTAEPQWAIDTLCTYFIKKLDYRVIVDFETPCLHMQSYGDQFISYAIDKAVPKLDFYIRKHKVYALGVNL